VENDMNGMAKSMDDGLKFWAVVLLGIVVLIAVAAFVIGSRTGVTNDEAKEPPAKRSS